MNNPLNFTLLLLALLLPATAVANDTYDFYVDGIYYDVNGNEAAVTCKYLNVNQYGMFTIKSDYRGNVVIPSTVTYNDTTYQVTSIDIYAFNDCDSLTSVTIPNSVTSIGGEAFMGCNNLASVTIPNSVTSIGVDAFSGTRWYNNQPDGLVYAGLVAYKYKGAMPESTSITIREGTLGIADAAFSGCRGLTNVTIPESVTSIGNWAFMGCNNLTSVTIPNSVTSISEWAFSGCRSLSSVTIPNSVTSIGGDAFSDTRWYNNQPDGLVYAGLVAYQYKGTMPEGTSIIIRDGTLSIANCAFTDCSGLTSVAIPNSVTSIGPGVFSGCSSLASVTIPNSVTSIDASAFSGCSSLTSVTIPNSVTSIGYGAFKGCSGLTDLIWNARNCSTNGDMVTSNLERVTIGNEVEVLPLYFVNGSKITSAIIPNSVTSISNSAFSGCRDLTSITIPESVTSIGNSAFDGCSGLTSVIIPNSVTSIGSRAFFGCSGLTSVSIGNAVTSIGNYAFDSCSGLSSVSIPNSVTYIGDCAFYDCSALTSVNLPNSIVNIGKSAFCECPNISEVMLLNPIPPLCTNMTTFDNNVFNDAKLYVPKESVDLYNAADKWGQFDHIIGVNTSK